MFLSKICLIVPAKFFISKRLKGRKKPIGFVRLQHSRIEFARI